MNKQKFLNEIKANLKDFKKDEVKRIIEYYDEMINDKIEMGICEEDAIRSLGDVNDITTEIKTNLLGERSNNKATNSLKNFLLILGICTSPVLLPIGIIFTVLFFLILILIATLFLSIGVTSISLFVFGIVNSIEMIMIGENIGIIMILLGLSFIIGSFLSYLTLQLYNVGKVILNYINKLFLKIIKRKRVVNNV
ncbi:MAG TPA: DUF1700 domain-containing protein [Acholeplasmataceae bacterium]|nr:DUF1700 domain-containing protein [Acholeplasmataceae bacterium]